MKHSSGIIAFATAALLCACSQTPHSLPVMNISADLEAPNTTDFEQAAEIRLALYPAATDSTLLSYPGLRAIVDGEYFIQSGNLMVFDKDGKCLSSFNHVGEGPEEYGQWDQALVECSTKEWIMLSSQLSPIVKRYSMNGKYLGKDSLFAASNLKPLADGWIATNNGLQNPELTLYYYDRNFTLTDSLPTPFRHRVYKQQFGSTGLNLLLSTNGKDAFIFRNDTIFNLTSPKAGPVPTAVAILSNRMIPEDFNIAENRDWYQRFIEPTFVYGKEKIMVWIRHEDRVYMRIYDLKSGNLDLALSNDITHEHPGLIITLDGKENCTSGPIYADGDMFYLQVSDSQMSVLTGNEDSNPAILSLRIK